MELETVRDLARKSFAAKAAFYKRTEEPKEYGSEEWIRWEVVSKKLCRAHIDAENAYRDAADAYFKAMDDAEQQVAA